MIKPIVVLLSSCCLIASGTIVEYVLEPFGSLGHLKTEPTVGLAHHNSSLSGNSSALVDVLPAVLSYSNPAEQQPHNCMGADHVGLWFKPMLESQSTIGLELFFLVDGQCTDRPDCQESYFYKNSDDVEQLEVLEDGWMKKTWSLGLENWESRNFGPFALDDIRGWKLVMDDGSDLAKQSSLLLDRISCVGDDNLLGAALLSNHPLADSFEVWEVVPNDAANSTNLGLSEEGVVTVNYTVGKAETWGGFFSMDFFAPGVSFFNLSAANTVRFDYSISLPASSERSHLRLILLDDSDCEYDDMGRGCHGDQSVEIFYSFHHVLEEPTGSNGRIQIDLDGDSDPSSPFWRSGWAGTVGNDKLDPDRIKGFVWQIVVDGDGELNDLTKGTLTLSNLAASDIQRNVTADDLGTCEQIDLAYVDNIASLQKVSFQSDCCAVCSADPSCLYVIESVLRQKDCYIATNTAPLVRLARTETELSSQKVIRIKHAASQLGYCDVCKCDDTLLSIDCQGSGLALLPSSFDKSWKPKRLDLRNNSLLHVIGDNDFSPMFVDLVELYLPKSLAYLSNATIKSLPNLLDVKFEFQDQSVETTFPGNVVISDGQSFSDVCCSRGQSVAGLTFCDMQVTAIGSDTAYEPFAHHTDGIPILELRPSSSFMSEAAESPQKCAEYCKNLPECTFFQYDARVKEAEHSCVLLQNSRFSETSIACCEDIHFGDENRTLPGFTSGRPPRSRHEFDNARVLLQTNHLALESESNFVATYSVMLGSSPLRGAVWIEPTIASEWKNHIEISPSRVVLYDNHTAGTITVSVIDPDEIPRRSEAFVLTNEITSCDTSFTSFLDASDAGQLGVVVTVVNDRNVTSILLSVLIPGAVLVVAAAIIVWFFLKNKETKANNLWSVKEEELIFGDPPEVIGSGTFGQVVLAEYRGTEVAVKQALPQSTSDATEKTAVADTTVTNRQIQRSTATYVLQKRLGEPLAWNSGAMGFMGNAAVSSFVDEIRTLSTLRHPNITTILGAVSNRGKEMIVLEYMQHGSLNNLLANTTLRLEEFLLPLICDISQGMRFLHAAAPQVVHGDLKSHNVLVDSKFRAKVADFGLSHKRNGSTGTPYWMAPELLRNESRNSCESDVYSFGIVLYEVYARTTPYEGEECHEVLEQIIDPEICKRPSVPPGCPVKVEILMNDCLKGAPLMRPNFEEINMQLRRMNMEAASAASTISDQTEALLNDVFPKHIAEALRQGKPVEPEHHECVSIFFSDVVGYTKISSTLSPIKVSDMLGRLYGRFDELLDVYGVFKVETIGDAFMAVTNLSDDQPDHMKRLADFARNAINAARGILVDEDDPDKGHISIRVGIHSGPVVSNVVGKRNPRYCLFGDTVNVSSRMESTSEVNRIQCSSKSATMLVQQDPSATMTPRGLVEIKGKGSMATYWVGDLEPIAESPVAS